jgi:hypothetical protein
MNRRVIFYETRNLKHLKNICNQYHDLGYETEILTEKYLETSSEWKDFQSNYKHASTNHEAFELACFARYFALNEYYKSGIISIKEYVILSDSDVIPQFEKSEKIFLDKLQDTFVASQNYITINTLEPQYSPHFSIWNFELLSSFIDHIIDFYVNRYAESAGDIKARYERIGMNSSISDMTLLYEWVEKTKINFFNFSDFSLEHYTDHNISSPYNVIGDNSDRSILIYNPFKQRIGYFSLRRRKCHWPVILHVQGGKKRLIPLFYTSRLLFYIFVITWLFADKLKLTKFVRGKK